MSFRIWKKPPSKILSQEEVDETISAQPPSDKVYSKRETMRIDRELARTIRYFEKLLKSAIASMPGEKEQSDLFITKILNQYSRERFEGELGLGDIFKIEASGMEISVYSYLVYDWPVPDKFYIKNGSKFNLYRIDLDSKTTSVEMVTRQTNNFLYEFELTFPVQKVTYKVVEWLDIPYDIFKPENNKDLFKLALASDIYRSNRGTEPLGMFLLNKFGEDNSHYLLKSYYETKKFTLKNWEKYEGRLKYGT